jgi:cystathionine beta-lyase/cystathionine gamma-synthase
VYARWANTTVDLFEAAVADLEGAEEAEAFSSGMAAISSVFLALCRAGDRIVATRQLYGTTFSLLAQRLPRYGIETTFCELADYDSIASALQGATLLYCETIGNPRIQVADLEQLAGLADEAKVPLVVDNTFASPVLCRPIELGAHMVVHSATKYLGGHHDLLGGVVCGDSGSVNRIRALARDLGPTLAPFNAWLALRGMATLHLRVVRSSESALILARALLERDDIGSVHYPTLPSDPYRSLAEKQLSGLGGGTLGFEVAGGRERAKRFQDGLELVLPAASLGGSHTLLVHSASVTHTQLSSDELATVGISEGFCRLSVGLEDPGDILADLTLGLTAAGN